MVDSVDNSPRLTSLERQLHQLRRRHAEQARIARRGGRAVGTVLCILMLCLPAIATAVSLPHTFSSGDPISAAQVNENFDELVQAVTTLEAGPATLVQSSSSGMFTTSSETWVDVDNLELMITTAGEHVLLDLVGSTGGEYSYLRVLTGGTSAIGLLRIERTTDGGPAVLVAESDLTLAGVGALNVPIGARFLDAPPAGTHTYRVQASVLENTNGQEFHVRFAQLLAQGTSN